jgi:hypothetical protein
MTNNKYPADLSYFRLSLLAFLRESHPHLANDESFISARTEIALNTYSQAVSNGNSNDQAAEQANTVLFHGLHFSKHDTLVNILWNEFSDEIPEEEAKTMAIKLLPQSEHIFSQYELTDDFAYEPEYDLLYTELTGAIALIIEKRNF